MITINFNETDNPVLLMKEYIVKGTILNYCIDIPFTDGFAKLMTPESLDKFKNKSEKCHVDVIILDQDLKVLIQQKTSCIYYNDTKMRINLPVEFHTKLQQIFWFSSAVSMCNNKYFETLDEALIETCNIFLYSSEKPIDGYRMNSIVFKPVKTVSMYQMDDSMPTERKMLIEMAHIFSNSGLFILNQKTENNKAVPENEVIHATVWKSVEDFKEQADLTNCVYYLANSATKKVYIGEAKQLRSRVCVRRINGVEYLVHVNQHDLDAYQFTEYRIDQITPKAYSRMLHSFQDGIIGSADALSSKFPQGYSLTNSAYNQAHGLRRNQK